MRQQETKIDHARFQVFQHVIGRHDMHLDLHTRHAAVESIQRFRDLPRGGKRRIPDDDMPPCAGRILARGADGSFELGHRLARILKKDGPLGRGQNARAAAVKDTEPQIDFSVFHGFRNGGLRDIERLGGCAKPAGVRHGQSISQMPQVEPGGFLGVGHAHVPG